MQKWLDKAAIAALAVLLSAGYWRHYLHSALTGNTKLLKRRGKLLKTTSREKLAGMFHLCRDGAVAAAPPILPTPASVVLAAPTSKR